MPFSGPSDKFSGDLVMDGPEKGKCRSIISISLINWNSQLKSKHNLHNIFGNFCKLLYVK